MEAHNTGVIDNISKAYNLEKPGDQSQQDKIAHFYRFALEIT